MFEGLPVRAHCLVVDDPKLPALPHSVTELDLWNGLLTDLQQLTRLTNLKSQFVSCHT